MPIVLTTPFKISSDFIPYSYFDTFDQSYSGSANPSYWDVATNPAIVDVGTGYAELKALPEYHSLNHRYALRGDFEIIAQYGIISGWSAPTSGDNFRLLVKDNPTRTESRYIYRESLNDRITASDGVSLIYTNNTGITYGGLRITRLGTDIRLYYRDGTNAWNERGAFTDFTGNADAFTQLYTSNTDVVVYVYDISFSADEGVLIV